MVQRLHATTVFQTLHHTRPELIWNLNAALMHCSLLSSGSSSCSALHVGGCNGLSIVHGNKHGE